MTSTSSPGKNSPFPAPSPERRIFCNRTLNLRSIRAIGYDLDYTLIHYNVDAWERTSFGFFKEKLAQLGWPTAGLTFDQNAFQIGLIIDRHFGNIIKADQFGYIRRGSHGTAAMEFSTLRKVYQQTIVELPDPRYVFLNTLFSLSEACMYAQLVDRLDAGQFPTTLGYADLYDQLKRAFDELHMEGRLKATVAAQPERFVDRDAETAAALLDQKRAGKKLLLITNSEWRHTRAMLDYGFGPHLSDGVTWNDLFDIIIVEARKPSFFEQANPAFEVVNDEGLLKPIVGVPKPGQVLLGGHAGLVEEMLGLSGSQILYLGDHAFGDVQVSKNLRRWRTALIVRELEEEIHAQEAFRPEQLRLSELMERKTELEHRFSEEQLKLQRMVHGPGSGRKSKTKDLKANMERTRQALADLDKRITPLAIQSAELLNPKWGLLMRTGNDPSYLGRIMERHADIYTSRVSNFLHRTPFAFFRARRSGLPHDEAVGRVSAA